jgi:hypothetical protein
MKKLMVFLLAVISIASHAASKDDDFDPEALAAANLKNSGSVWVDAAPAKKDPASGFWTCNGVRLHMGVDLASWQNLDTQELFTLEEKPEREDAPGPVHNGMAYLYSSMNNPAYVRGFAVDKAGKQLYIQDELKFTKYYRCNRTN